VKTTVTHLLEKKSWFPDRSEWSEVITFLAGCLGRAAEPLIDLLNSDPVDILRHRQTLALACLAELPEQARCERQVDDLTGAVLDFLKSERGEIAYRRACFSKLLEVNGRVDGVRLRTRLREEAEAWNKQRSVTGSVSEIILPNLSILGLSFSETIARGDAAPSSISVPDSIPYIWLADFDDGPDTRFFVDRRGGQVRRASVDDLGKL
jgi:hypothetical protein